MHRVQACQAQVRPTGAPGFAKRRTWHVPDVKQPSTDDVIKLVLPCTALRYADNTSGFDMSSMRPSRLPAEEPSVQDLAHLAASHQHLRAWFDFWRTYGLREEDMTKMFSRDILQAADVYTAGEAILFFKQYGYRDQDIRARIVAYYPFLLTKSVPDDFLPVVHDLECAGCCGRELQLLVWEYPRIFQHDYKRHIRKFARLGVYGLSLDRLPPV